MLLVALVPGGRFAVAAPTLVQEAGIRVLGAHMSQHFLALVFWLLGIYAMLRVMLNARP